MNSLQSKVLRVLEALYRTVLMPPLFQVLRVFRDQVFLIELRNSNLRPAVIAPILYFPLRVYRALGRMMTHTFNEYALSKYVSYIQHHYSKGGRGYFAYADLSDQEKIGLFGVPKGRIAPLIDSHGHILGLKDGDSFFDVGCGRGQNIKVLMERFPNSPIRAIDISAEAVDVIDLAVSDPRVTTQVCDLKDAATYAGIGDNTYDHVVMSHVMALLIGGSIAETRATRRMIISNLVRIARKSVVIIDNPAILADQAAFKIEQLNRGYFAESILPYFPANAGAVVTVKLGESVAVVSLPAVPGKGKE